MRKITIEIACGECTCDECNQLSWNSWNQVICKQYEELLKTDDDNCYRCDRCFDAEAQE